MREYNAGVRIDIAGSPRTVRDAVETELRARGVRVLRGVEWSGPRSRTVGTTDFHLDGTLHVTAGVPKPYDVPVVRRIRVSGGANNAVATSMGVDVHADVSGIPRRERAAIVRAVEIEAYDRTQEWATAVTARLEGHAARAL